MQIKTHAFLASRDTQCGRCKLSPFTDTMREACSTAFCRGFIAGTKYERRRTK